MRCHAPHGACGLKHGVKTVNKVISSHAPHGACGLKLHHLFSIRYRLYRHAPHGACGLKRDNFPTRHHP